MVTRTLRNGYGLCLGSDIVCIMLLVSFVIGANW